MSQKCLNRVYLDWKPVRNELSDPAVWKSLDYQCNSFCYCLQSVLERDGDNTKAYNGHNKFCTSKQKQIIMDVLFVFEHTSEWKKQS